MEIEKPTLYFIMCLEYKHKDGTITKDMTLAMVNDEELANKNALLWQNEPECIGNIVIRPVKS